MSAPAPTRAPFASTTATAPTRTPVPEAAAATAPPPPSVSLPRYALEEGPNGTTLHIGDWTISSTKRAILANAEIEAYEKELGLPLPEMTFGNNSLVLEHRKSGARLSFDTMEALRRVAVGEGWEERVGGGVLVSMAETWSKGRSATSVLSDVQVSTKPVRPHDWTFSTTYAGHSAGAEFAPSNTHEIPLPLLARQDPMLDRILFYDDVALFEDELHDNGESILNVRIRVMPHSFFILARLFVRVDNVLFRIFDVRVFHAFGSNEVIRECSGLEADYDDVKARLEKRDDMSPLTDANFVYATLGKMAATTAAPTAVPGPDGRPQLPPRQSSRSRGKAWPGLGRKVEVLRLDKSEESAREGIEKLAL